MNFGGRVTAPPAPVDRRDGESVDDAEKGLEGYDGVDDALEEFLGENRVFFDELGEVVQSRC